jgi:Do/DeqQ family serine protease
MHTKTGKGGFTPPFFVAICEGMKRLFIMFCMCMAMCVSSTHAQEMRVPISTQEISLSFAPVVKQTAPSVVNIYTSRKVNVASGFSPLFNDPFFSQFFGQRFDNVPQEREVHSLGSGVIVDGSGLVITSLHVVKDMSDIRVSLSDRREFEAQLVVADSAADLALLQLKGVTTPLSSITIVDADTLLVGDLVLAIGNPFGVGQTVTSGIISGLSRSAAGVNDYDFFIQTDAAINPGNSGGALVNMRGELVGINTAIYSKSGGSMGIGFAVPSNMVTALLHNRGKDGTVVRLWLGAEYSEVTPQVAKSLGLERISGVLVEDVVKGSPAEKAGIESGDVITAFDGKAVESVAALRFRVGTATAAAPAIITYLRKGKEYTVAVTLTPPPANPAGQTRVLRGKHALQGMTVGALTPHINATYHLPKTLKGVAILALPEGVISYMRAGDIITQCNGQAIATVEGLEKALLASPRKLTLQFIRDGHRMQLSLMQ